MWPHWGRARGLGDALRYNPGVNFVGPVAVANTLADSQVE